MAELMKLKEAIVSGNLEVSIEITNAALAEGVDPQSIISDYMITAMEEIGGRFAEGKAFVPELLLAARAMKGSLEIIKPLLTGEKAVTIGKVVIGTVYGDLHDIGKNLVASMFEGCGFEVVNLGVNVSAEKFVETAKAENANIVCLSALLTTTMGYMKTIIEALESAGIRDSVKVMVGGAPVNEVFAQQIGADGYSSNANEAVILARRLVAASA